jgi:hypothetical protein
MATDYPPQIVILRNGRNAGYATVEDVVFVNREHDICFSVRYVKSTTVIDIIESTQSDHMGMLGGTGFHRIMGTLTFALNSPIVFNQIMRNIDSLFEMHILFRDLSGLSIPYKDRDGTGLSYSGFYEYLSKRFPLIDDYRDEMGVRFSLSQNAGGTNRQFTLNLSGLTVEMVSGYAESRGDWYGMFPSLDMEYLER